MTLLGGLGVQKHNLVGHDQVDHNGFSHVIQNVRDATSKRGHQRGLALHRLMYISNAWSEMIFKKSFKQNCNASQPGVHTVNPLLRCCSLRMGNCMAPLPASASLDQIWTGQLQIEDNCKKGEYFLDILQIHNCPLQKRGWDHLRQSLSQLQLFTILSVHFQHFGWETSLAAS